ncbi:MAG: 30S ribosomal protein S17e [Nanoarchaeota archaeon]|nr:30S ribosomal protein S17e [Nanoarchaeota archaeon]
MGRIKTQQVKRITKEILKHHKNKLKKNFEENKPIVDEVATIPSKKMRNVIAGYATREMKREE